MNDFDPVTLFSILHEGMGLWLWLPLLVGPRADVSSAEAVLARATEGPVTLSGTVALGAVSALAVAPAVAVTVGLLLVKVREWLAHCGLIHWRWVWVGLLTLCGVALTGNLYAAQEIGSLAAREDAHLGYGTPYRPWRQIEAAIEHGIENSRADQLWVRAPAAQAETARLLYPQAAVLRNTAGQLLPAGRPGLYLEWDEGTPEGDMVERLGSRQVAAVAWPDGSQARVLELRERSPEELLALVPGRVNAHYDAGLYLVGFEWPIDAVVGSTVTFATYWTFSDLSSQDQATAHTVVLALTGPDGRQIAWSGPLALDGADWQEGLLLRQESTLTIPADWSRGVGTLYAEVHRSTDGTAVAILGTPTRASQTTAVLGEAPFN